MKRLLLLIVAIAAVISVGLPAHAVDPANFKTDGTQCSGPFCPGGPPPVAPSFAAGQECKIDVIDPVSFVFVTEHFVYGTVAPTPSLTPVVEDAFAVFNYLADPPNLVQVDIEQYVAGKQGFRADTWNIGLGVTSWVPFDCREPEPTTTTSTTVVPSTSTTSSTVAESTTTSSTIGTQVAVTADEETPAGQLPVTGSMAIPMTAFALFILGLGYAMSRSKKAGRH